LINPDFQNEVIGKLYFFMKRLPEIITLFCIIVGSLTSGTAAKRSDDISGKGFPIQPAHDTTGLVGYLKVDSFNLDIIPPSSGIQFFRNGIVFLSNTKYEGKMLPKHVSFGSIEAYTAIVKDTSLGSHQLFSPTKSFSFPCEAITFSADYKTMYFVKIAKNEIREKIYHAEFKSYKNGESGWVIDENPLDFCKGNYIYTHPALSDDGKILIFASDMKGTLGEMDLFIVKREGVKWSKPKNLGKEINTTQNECFSYIDRDNNLFFSSDGLSGYGGYDVFSCRFNGERWEIPMNLSRRINSVNDDIAFSIDKTDGKSAFYTSRQKSENGSMQLFKVTLMQAIADNNPQSISYIFNGNPGSAEVAAMTTVEQLKPSEKEPAKGALPEAQKEMKTEGKKATAEPTVKSTSAKVVTIKSTAALPAELKDVVVYRVQFLTTTRASKENQVIINGITYKTYEYLYLNAYRYTIGEFTTLPPAKQLQSLCRKSGYPDAFVAAFKNDTRSVDLTFFK